MRKGLKVAVCDSGVDGVRGEGGRVVRAWDERLEEGKRMCQAWDRDLGDIGGLTWGAGEIDCLGQRVCDRALKDGVWLNRWECRKWL